MESLNDFFEGSADQIKPIFPEVEEGERKEGERLRKVFATRGSGTFPSVAANATETRCKPLRVRCSFKSIFL